MKLKIILITIGVSIILTSCYNQQSSIIKESIETNGKEVMELRREIDGYKEKINILDTEKNSYQDIQRKQEIDILMYKSLTECYKQILMDGYSSNNEVSLVSANGIEIGMTFSEVIKYLGKDYSESTYFNEYRGVAESKWIYDGIEVQFDPVYVNRIIITTDNIKTNIGVIVGDIAIDSLESIKNNFTVADTPNGGRIFNWFNTGDGNYLILYFDKEAGRTNQSPDITDDLTIEKIEIAKIDIFD